MRSRSLTVPTAAVALLAAGCGGGSNAPTKAEYGQNASRVCTQLESETNDAASGSPTTSEQIVAYADKLRKVLDGGVQKLDNVRRPDGKDGEKAKAYVDELRRQIDTQIKPALVQLKAAAAKKDAAGVQTAAKRIQSLDDTKIKRLARAAGAKGCAS